MLIARLRMMLSEVRRRGGEDFVGVGVIVARDPIGLPILALNTGQPSKSAGDVVEQLASVARADSPYHDGFHVLSPKLEVLLLSQFFAPAIPPGISLRSRPGAGARYAAALLGSRTPGVLATGLSTKTFGVAVFHRGRLIESEG